MFSSIVEIEEEDDSDASSSDEDTPHKAHVAINREDIYKVHHKGTLASKKKKKAKLQSAIRSLKKQQHITSEKSTSNYHTPLNHLRDPQEFAEKLFSRLQNSTKVERFEVKMMMLKVVARTIGLHRLVVLNFYPYFMNYITPHQNGVTELLAAAVQACHDMVPPDAVEPLFKQIIIKFVVDRAQPEAIAVGLNTIREICLRMPLLMTEDLLQDLALYKKSHTKAVSVAARSLIGLFRELNPSLLIKKDRGRQHVNSKARPKAYGEVDVLNDVPGLDLLKNDDDNEDSDDNDDDDDEPSLRGADEMLASSDDEDLQITNTDSGSENDDMMSEDGDEIDDNDSDVSGDEDEAEAEDEDEAEAEDEDEAEAEDEDEAEAEDEDEAEAEDEEENTQDEDEESDKNDGSGVKENTAKKRKFADFDTQLNDAEASLRTLKRLAKENMGSVPSDSTDGFLSNEDFRRIKELKAKQRLTQQGLLKKSSDAKSTAFRIPTSDELSSKRVDPAKLEVHVKRRMTKEEKLALVKAGREDRGKYISRAAVKQKKTGGLSNKQKEHKKAMPLVAKRAKVAKSRVEKRKKQQLSGKNFRGKKVWK
ncbi:hypothetical protein ACLB2K_039521 [Fragaria x ananassa]